MQRCTSTMYNTSICKVHSYSYKYTLGCLLVRVQYHEDENVYTRCSKLRSRWFGEIRTSSSDSSSRTAVERLLFAARTRLDVASVEMRSRELILISSSNKPAFSPSSGESTPEVSFFIFSCIIYRRTLENSWMSIDLYMFLCYYCRRFCHKRAPYAIARVSCSSKQR